MEFEEVEMEEDYLIEGDISDASPVKTSHEPAPKVARLVPKSEPSTSGRKIPIIRSAGAVVTPVRTAIRKPVQERPENNEHDAMVTESDKRVACIEEQLDAILARLAEREDQISYIRNSIAYTGKYMKKKIRALKRQHFTHCLNEGQHERKRLKLITFPIPDQEYFDRLEATLDDNEDLQKELITRFYMAPQDSAYKFFRWNLPLLFDNTIRYSWTGRASSLIAPNRIPACYLKTVRLLLKCGAEIFHQASADTLEKECRLALRHLHSSQDQVGKRRLAEMRKKRND
ncbi:uncharacterized protein LOC129745632 isoform X8 [Uranotaenia lowii]|uniref:uncharacterized protein LOC129745632 isoform X8 n=1 Tax=Uranotaenia lowii TaxID=190385 RepID=UPI00247A5941|nr:uncharacterized protein LOC129745632 isoform X8 [Uranotaenia lowii]